MINAFSTLWGAGLTAFNQAQPQAKTPQAQPTAQPINAFNVAKATNSFTAIQTAQVVKEKQKQAKFYYKGGKYLLKKEGAE